MAQPRKRQRKTFIDPDTGLLVGDPIAFAQFKQNIAPVAGLRLRPGQGELVAFDVEPETHTAAEPEVVDPEPDGGANVVM